VKNAENTDWEDIAAGKQGVYVGDVGNNYAARDTFTIYTIPWPELEKDTALAVRMMHFSFADKPVGSIPMHNNSFDCEALCLIRDSLWIFTKDWNAYRTGVYFLPLHSANHQTLSRQWDLNTSMRVTGADYCEKTSRLWLIGYRRFQPVLACYSLPPDSRPPEKIMWMKLGNRIGLQTEAIGYVYFSYEKSKRRQGFFRIKY
jgi:hypothetical protein